MPTGPGFITFEAMCGHFLTQTGFVNNDIAAYAT